MKKIGVQELTAFCEKALIATGSSEVDAKTIAEVLVTTDTFGVNSHGTKNLYEYIMKEKAGGLDVNAVPEIVNEGPSWALVDGHDAMGMVSSAMGMKLAVEKAKKTGIAYVGVKNSCHFGAAGYYANIAAEAGMIGLAMSNADPTMTIPNGSGVTIGNNPFSYAAPLSDGTSIFLDIALSSVAALKVVLAKASGDPVPGTWLVDKDGVPTTDASGFPYESHLQPMAAHKGYGLAVMVEALTSVITGCALMSGVRSWNLDPATKNEASHAFIAIDAAAMTSKEAFLGMMDKMNEEIHKTVPAKGKDCVFAPGEMEWNKRTKAIADGIPATDAMVTQLTKLSELTGIPIEWIEA